MCEDGSVNVKKIIYQSHIQSECGEYSLEKSQSHIALLWI